MNDLQRLVDSLAARLHRAVAIDDPSFRLVAYSTGVGDRDLVREQVILDKAPPAEADAWAHQLRLVRAAGPMRVENRDLKILSRLVIPVRFRDVHLGALWIIDPDSRLGADEIALAEAAADGAGLILFRERSAGLLVRDRVRTLTLDLLNEESDDETRNKAVGQLVEEELFPDAAAALAIVVRPASDGALDADDRILLDDALWGLEIFPRRPYLNVTRPDHALTLFPVLDGTSSDLPEQIHSAAQKALPTADLVVGVGVAQPLESVLTSYRQATQALRIADAVPGLGPVVRIEGCGVYRFFAGATDTDELRASIHPALSTLRTEAPWLLPTLESFLDNAGNTAAVGRSLILHRSTVYAHIERIEALSGIDLGKGEDRLAVHLSLRIARLLGEL